MLPQIQPRYLRVSTRTIYMAISMSPKQERQRLARNSPKDPAKATQPGS